MDLRSLRYFQAVYEYGSYRRASESLRISQPAVSRQVARLEGELGQRLFDRTGHGVVPTEAGRLLFERSQSLLRQLRSTVDEIRNLQAAPSGTLTIAVPPGAGHFLVPALMRRYRANYPRVFLKVLAGFSGTIQEWLVRGRVDLACIHGPLPQRGFNIEPLIDEEVYLVGSSSDALLARDSIPARALDGLPLILPSHLNTSRRLIDAWLSSRHVTPMVEMEADDTSMLRQLLREQLGYTLMCQGSFANDLGHGELSAVRFRPRWHWPLTLVSSSARPRDELVEVLARTVVETVRSLASEGTWPGRLLAR